MTALGFKKQFAGPVELRIKRQSIRENYSRFKVGATIQLYTGMRTKSCRKLVEIDPVCTSVTPIVIAPDYVALDGWRLPAGDLAQLAVADGFPSVAHFLNFFIATRPEFSGGLIKWDWLDGQHHPSARSDNA